MDEDPEKTRLLEALRANLRRKAKSPITVSHGPRYLHSTGQLYKGGAPTGPFLVLTEPEASAIPAPGERLGFGVLHGAHARGDLAAMRQGGRRVLRLDLGTPVLESLRSIVHASAR